MGAGELVAPGTAIGDFWMVYASRVVSFLLVMTEVGLRLLPSTGIVGAGATSGEGAGGCVGGPAAGGLSLVRADTE